MEETNYVRPTPPPLKKRLRRPKKARRKDQNEGQVSNNKLKRTYKEVTCTRCGLSRGDVQMEECHPCLRNGN